MPIPPRLRPPTPSVEEMREYTSLCRRIESTLSDHGSLSPLLARWNARAGRAYRPSDFRYHGAVDTTTFVGEMLLGTPGLVPDLSYPELREVLRSFLDQELSETVESYFLAWLEANLPGAKVSELIYWPNQWFNDESLLNAEFTPDQFLAYAMAKSGRQVPGAPANVPMPYPMPTNS